LSDKTETKIYNAENFRKFFFFFFLIIIFLLILFVVVMPLFFQPENIYRKNIIQNQTYKATPEYIDEINKIYGETNPIKKYNDFNKLKNKNISDSLLQLGNKIDNEILSNINTVSELANNSNNILKVLPRFEELVKIYEQLPSIKISTALDNVKTTYINNLKSGEIETLAEFKAKYSTFNPNSSNIIEAQKLQEIGNSIIIYIQTRLKIAKETEIKNKEAKILRKVR